MQQRRLVVYYTLDTGPDSSLAYYRCTTCPLVVHHWYLNQHAIAAHWAELYCLLPDGINAHWFQTVLCGPPRPTDTQKLGREGVARAITRLATGVSGP